MRPLSFVLLLVIPFASAGFFSGQVALGETDLAVPGDNPITFCQAPDDDLLIIDHVNLKPNPPTAGAVLSIEAKGNFTEKIEKDAYVLLTVKWGLVRLIYSREDLCVQMKNVDKECPLEEGESTLTKEVELPSQIPPGVYTVIADVFTADDRKITCLTAKVAFGKK